MDSHLTPIPVHAPLATVPGPIGFRDVTLCGRGATSRVYRAVDASQGRVVALKRLHPQLVRSPEALARLRRELDVLRTLRHPGIVPVYDLVRWDGDPTVVMQYVRGEDLKERIRRVGRLDAHEVLHIARALLEILALTHGSGIVHRDLKPQNVRLSDDGRVFLLDFGSARLDAASQLTRTGTTVGTPEYMPPELFAGSVYNPRVDLYGLGVTLFECLTGRTPHAADSLAELAHLRTSTDAPGVASLAPATPPALARLVDRCLRRAVEERYASASLALFALDHPGEEAALAAHRSRLPPCLHCQTPLDARANVCPVCKNDHPFSYAPGTATVLLRSVREPAALLAFLAARFPERAVPGQLEVLAQRCAALSAAPQRLVSFVARDEAARLVAQLHAAGVHAEVVTEPALGAPFWLGLAGALGCALWLGPLWALGALLAGLLVDRGLALGAASRSMLGSGQLPAPVAPGLNAATCLAAIPAALLWALLPYPPAWVTCLFAATLVAGLGTACFNFRRAPLDPRLSPQPGARQQLAQTLTPRVAGAQAKGPAPRASKGVVLLIAFCLVPLEMILALSIGTYEDVRLIQRHLEPAAAPVAAPAVVAAPVVTQAVVGPGLWVLARPLVAAGSPLLVAAGMLALVGRRRRRIRLDAAQTLSELDWTAFKALAGRRPPVHGRRARLASSAADRVAGLSPPDAFVGDALRRAAELMPLLGPHAAARLAGAAELLCEARPHAAAQARSLAARCILETDPEQRTRFEFLALEGQLEAEAASAWAEVKS